jgi:hypothetical protein
MNPKKRCVVDDCDRPHHGRGYCGPHYQEWRRTGERPDHDWIRESWQEQQLLLGFTGEGVGYPFEDEAEERKAWERRRAEWEQKWKRPARSHTPGSRPAAWWKFIAGRPHRVLHWPSHGHTVQEMLDYEIEPLEWLAREGHLEAWEINKIREDAAVAAARFGTPSERLSGVGPGGDGERIITAQRVDRALGEAGDERYKNVTMAESRHSRVWDRWLAEQAR